MAGRSQVVDPITKVVRIVEQELGQPSQPDRTSAANYRGLPSGGGAGDGLETPITLLGDDGSGNAVTFWFAMTELDSTNSDYAVTGTGTGI